MTNSDVLPTLVPRRRPLLTLAVLAVLVIALALAPTWFRRSRTVTTSSGRVLDLIDVTRHTRRLYPIRGGAPTLERSLRLRYWTTERNTTALQATAAELVALTGPDAIVLGEQRIEIQAVRPLVARAIPLTLKYRLAFIQQADGSWRAVPP